MKTDKAKAILERLEADSLIQNFIAQSDSRFILFNVQEPIENFPKYSQGLDEKLTSTALSYLSVGCSYAEQGIIGESIFPLEKGATILENIYSPSANRNDYSSYFVLASSLAFYAANQYSKSYTLLKNISVDTVIGDVISKFLRRQYTELDKSLSEILLSNDYVDKTIAAIDEEAVANNRIYILILSKSFASLLEFIFSGKDEWLNKAKEYLKDLLELLSIDLEPSLWWVVRLLLLIFEGFQENSLWKVIPPYIGEDTLVDNYIASLAFQKNPVVELFYSQKIALPSVVDKKGAVVSLPTSSGKTRVAELSILDCLASGTDNKILYLAPFRSLAYEIEDSITKVFEPLGFEISHLYGGTQFSKLDEMVIQESNIIIATPEKAKAILRSNSEVKSKINLVIIDEGHLIGPEDRQILSEVLIEELRKYMENNQGKMMLLSAVLPNSAEIAKWIAGSETRAVNSDWRPSSQRLGLLEYNGSNVTITWKGDIESYNRNFISPFKVVRPRSEYTFPRDKKQAVASAALKLSYSGSVLIFVCRKNMVMSQAEEVIQAMGHDKEEHVWSCIDDWNIFELSCSEAYGEESKVYKCAKYGVLCHHAGLPTEVRLSMERLIRKSNPKIIVATSTLGQGVNIGVSTVIFSNVWYDGSNRISINDFWNIAGRAGRSFVDREGKILFLVDASRGSRIARRDRSLAREYFEHRNQDDAISGLLFIVHHVYEVANEVDISFETLLQMIAENNYSALKKEHIDEFSTIFDLIDDTLLALNLEVESYKNENPSAWIDDYFRTSLAYIQAERFENVDGNDVISFLKARNEGVLKLAGEPILWKGLVSSSIPFRSGLFIRNEISVVLDYFHEYQNSNKDMNDFLTLIRHTEKFISKFPSEQFEINEVATAYMELWISGQSISSLDESIKMECNNYFTFKLPWGIHAISRMLATLDFETEAKEFESLAVLVQMGVPNMFAAKIYLAGIQSRVAATELSTILNPRFEELSLRMLKRIIMKLSDEIASKAQPNTIQWVNLLEKTYTKALDYLERIPSFSFTDNLKLDCDVLMAKYFNGETYMCSPDYTYKVKVKVDDKFHFDKYANNLGIVFINREDEWFMESRNPNHKLNPFEI
ncbi:DEAD/DEAH box helicase [Cytobacillus dafuensis]|uniref:DEAD/DEAH box helicase n=1 Tax=Cytobacillus dafuensis TaxID=1742359 RepID=A0A5B8Z3V0_CYTDA|nr:DEAD/DEAH box helicase [Cytobacillus dafuensis]QED46006.1 DEAD/DEAH box helicase [Cytobacillus dafuensis]